MSNAKKLVDRQTKIYNQIIKKLTKKEVLLLNELLELERDLTLIEYEN